MNRRGPDNGVMAAPRIYRITFASVYPLYLQKAERKGRTRAEVDEIIRWLTGYTDADLQRLADSDITLQGFFAHAPSPHENRSLITGVICGLRVEDIEDDTTREIRYLDKLIDELARGKAITKILRSPK